MADFGPPPGQQPQSPPDPPDDGPAILPANYLQIGPYELGTGTDAKCIVIAKPKSDSKVDKKEADGKNGAVTTWKGAKPSQWEIDLSWNRSDVAADAAIEEILYQVSPVGPNPGKPWTWSSRRARIHGTDTVIVENVDGPDDEPGTDLVKAKLKATSWKKSTATTQGQGKADTDDDPAGEKDDPPDKTKKDDAAKQKKQQPDAKP